MCSGQLQSLEKISPRCLCEVTSLLFCSPIFRGGCKVLLCLRDSTMDSDLVVLKDTSHLEAINGFLRGLHLMNLLPVEVCLQ